MVRGGDRFPACLVRRRMDGDRGATVDNGIVLSTETSPEAKSLSETRGPAVSDETAHVDTSATDEDPYAGITDEEKKALYAMDLGDVVWERCGPDDGSPCVEIAYFGENADNVAMRDSRHPEGPILRFTPGEWNAFVLGVQDGEFDFDFDEEPEDSEASA